MLNAVVVVPLLVIAVVSVVEADLDLLQIVNTMVSV
jgi:hypothetical protein